MEDCNEDELDQIVYADMDVVVAVRPTRRNVQPQEQQRQVAPSRIVERDEYRGNENASQKRDMADELENLHVPARTQAVGRAIRQKSIMLNLSHSDMLGPQGEWETGFSGSSKTNRSHDHATEDVDLVEPSQNSSNGPSQGNVVVSSAVALSSQTSSSSKSSASIDLTVESRPSIQPSQRSATTSRAPPRPHQTPSDAPGKARDLNKSIPSKPTKTAPAKSTSAPKARPLKPTSSFASQPRRQPLAATTDSTVPSFLINDRPAHWVSSGGVGVKRQRPPSRSGDKNAKPQRASVPPTTTLAAMRRSGGAQAHGTEVSFKPKWISEPADDRRNESSEIQDFVGCDTYDGEEADLGGSPGQFAEGFNPGTPVGRDSWKSNRRKSSDRVGPLVAKFRQTRSRVEGDLRRLQSGAFPLSKFLSSRGIADLGDPRTGFTSYLDVRLGEKVKFAVEGFEALLAEIHEEARIDTGGQPPHRLKVLEDSAMRGVVAIVVFKRTPVANPSLQPDNVLRIYNPCVVADVELVRKACATQQDDVPTANHLVLCTELNELLPRDAEMQQADDAI